MKAFKQTFAIALCALAIGACAKKDGNFASKNSMGAKAVRNQAVQDAVAAGVKLDFFGINTVSTNPMQFRVDLMVNDLHTVVTTYQQGTTPAGGSKLIGGYNVMVEGVCVNMECNPYYISATATAPNGQKYGQVGYKFYRLNSTADSDVYMLFDSAHILPFGNAMSAGDPNTMVGFLNQVPDAE